MPGIHNRSNTCSHISSPRFSCDVCSSRTQSPASIVSHGLPISPYCPPIASLISVGCVLKYCWSSWSQHVHKFSVYYDNWSYMLRSKSDDLVFRPGVPCHTQDKIFPSLHSLKSVLKSCIRGYTKLWKLTTRIHLYKHNKSTAYSNTFA